MKLKIGNFSVKDVQFGKKTYFEDGVLTINKEEAIETLNTEGGLKNIDLKIARPGESKRILPAVAATDVRYHIDGTPSYQGVTGPVSGAGEGTVYRIDGMSIISVSTHGGGTEGMVDMAGPGSEQSYFSKLINLCIVAEPVNKAEVSAGQNAGFHSNISYRRCICFLSEYLGKTLKGEEPDKWEIYEHTSISEKGLPKVALYIGLPGGSNVHSASYYGIPLSGVFSTMIHPNEILDGAILQDATAPPCSMSYTYSYMNSPLIKKVCEEHGKTLDFVGIMSSCYGGDLDTKMCYATATANLARMLHLDAVISTETGNGNIDVDYFTALAKFEDAGIKTVGITTEHPGRDGKAQSKSFLDPKANALVSACSVAQLYELPAMEVIGNIRTIGVDAYWGAWEKDAVLGPSLREDGSLIIDSHMFMDHGGVLGAGNKIVKNF